MGWIYFYFTTFSVTHIYGICPVRCELFLRQLRPRLKYPSVNNGFHKVIFVNDDNPRLSLVKRPTTVSRCFIFHAPQDDVMTLKCLPRHCPSVRGIYRSSSGAPWWRHRMKIFSRYWHFVRGIHRSPVNSPHKGQWRGALMSSLICAWTNGWVM